MVSSTPLMFPSLDAPFLASRAFGFERALLAGRGPVAMQGHAVLDGGIPPVQLLARRAAIYVLLGQIDEVVLVEAAFGLFLTFLMIFSIVSLGAATALFKRSL